MVTQDGTVPLRAPSWSWASVHGQIRYSTEFVLPLQGQYANAEEDVLRPPLAELLGMSCRYRVGYIHIVDMFS